MTRRNALLFSFTCLVLLAPVAAIAQSGADLSVSKNSPFNAAAGSDVPFDVTLLNAGPDDALTVSLTDPLPAGMTFVSLTQNNGPAFDCSSHPAAGANGTITCTIATLPAGSSANFTFTAKIPSDAAPGTTFTNIATATTATPDPNDENNSGAAAVTVPEQQADVSVTKLGPGSGLPNSDVAYTISVNNAGPDTATSVSLTDTLPGTMTFVSVVQNSGPAFDCSSQPAVGSGGTVTCTIAGLAAGASASFTLTGHIPNGTASGTSYANNATITSSTADPNPDNDTSGAFFTVASSDLAVSKSAPSTAIAGNMLAWTITATNNGTDTSPDATLNDVLPAGTTFVSVIENSGPTANCSGPAAGTTGSVTCTMGNFPPSTPAQFTITVTIDPAFTGTLNNTATISGSNADPNSNNNSSTASTTVSSSADLTINKSGPATANAGTDITYTVTLTNSGPSAAASVSLTDAVPANTTFVSSSQTTGPAFSCSKPAVGATGNVNCTIGSFAIGSATFSITVHIAASATGTVSNTALVSSATPDPNPTGNNPTVTTTVTRSADISVVKTAAATASAGSNLTYNITVTNNGPSDATTVTMSDTLPPNTTFVSETQNTGPAFTCTNPSVGGTGAVSCSIAALTAGTSATFTVIVHIAPGAPSGSSSNTAIVTSANDANAGNNSSTATTTISQSADISVVKTAPAAATAGTNITYNITVTNSGPSDATTVTMSDTLPPNTTFVSETQNTGPAFTCTNPSVGGTGAVSCSIASLTAGTSATFTVIVHIAPGAPSGSSSNTAVVTSANDANAGNNSSTATTTIGQSADISVVKTAPAAATAGTNLTYNITVTNSGPSDAATVTMGDTLPPNTTFVSESQNTGPAFTCVNPASGGTGAVSCSIAALTAGTSATFTVIVHVAPSAPPGSSSNTAIVTSANDANAGNNSSTATTTISQSADISVVKTAPAAATAGTNITYNITVTNSGPSDATTVTMTDTLPPNTTFVSKSQGSGPAFLCTNPPVGGTGAVSCSIAALTAGTSATFSVVVQIVATAPAGPLSNTATVTSANDTNAGNNSSTASTAVAAAVADLSITKTPAAGPYGTGSSLTYTILVTNGGPNVANNVVVTDVLPAGTTYQSSTPAGACSGTTTITCNAGTLANGASASFTMTIALPTTAGPITNTATVSAAASSPDTNLGNNTATSTITVIPAANIPMVSPLSLLLLGVVLAIAGAFVQKQ